MNVFSFISTSMMIEFYNSKIIQSILLSTIQQSVVADIFINCEYTSGDKDTWQYTKHNKNTSDWTFRFSDCSGDEVIGYEGTWADLKTHRTHMCVDSEGPVTNTLHFTTFNPCAHCRKTPATHLWKFRDLSDFTEKCPFQRPCLSWDMIDN